MTFADVDPNTLVSPTKTPHGRGAWNKTGIGFDYRYMVEPPTGIRIGTTPGADLAHWAVAAGCWAIQARLISLGHMAPIAASERGIFGPKSKAAVQAFQAVNSDPKTGTQLDDDGTVGTTDARSLFTPLVRAAERNYSIPNSLLVGETFHESSMDPGAVGYYIYYPDDRGVDRGMSQINSKSNPQVSWLQAFDPTFALNWSALRLRTYFDQYTKSYPKQSVNVLWDSAILAHNNPSAAVKMAKSGVAPTEAAADYVSAVHDSSF